MSEHEGFRRQTCSLDGKCPWVSLGFTSIQMICITLSHVATGPAPIL